MGLRIEESPFPSCSVEVLRGWSALAAEASEPSVFLTPEWLGAWWRAYGDGLTARLFVAWDRPGRLVGLAPLYAWRPRVAGLPGPRVISFMGDRSVGSEYLGLLIRSGDEEEFVLALDGCLRRQWALLDLHGLRRGGPVAEALPAVFGRNRPSRVHSLDEPCAAIRLPDTYEEYLASLPRKFRSTIRYRTNKLCRSHAARLVRTSRVEDLPGHLDRLFEMHEARWTTADRFGCFGDARMWRFYRDMSEAFLEKGWLRFYHLEVDGRIRASQFGFAFGGTLHSLQEAFDHAFRPPGIGGLGVVLRGMAIEESIREGLDAYDFLGGIEEFKTRWGTATHHVRRLRIGAPGLPGALAFASTAGLRMAKDRLRDVLPDPVLRGRERVRDWLRTRRVRRQAGR